MLGNRLVPVTRKYMICGVGTLRPSLHWLFLLHHQTHRFVNPASATRVLHAHHQQVLLPALEVPRHVQEKRLGPGDGRVHRVEPGHLFAVNVQPRAFVDRTEVQKDAPALGTTSCTGSYSPRHMTIRSVVAGGPASPSWGITFWIAGGLVT